MTLYVVRHALAEDKATWRGDDSLRPLSPAGLEQAANLARWFDDGIDEVVSSTTVRCLATVLPLAHRHGLDPILRSALLPGPVEAAADLARTMLERTTGVLCTHGEVIPAMLHVLDVRCRNADRASCEKGSIWELSLQPSGEITGRYHPAADVT